MNVSHTCAKAGFPPSPIYPTFSPLKFNPPSQNFNRPYKSLPPLTQKFMIFQPKVWGRCGKISEKRRNLPKRSFLQICANEFLLKFCTFLVIFCFYPSGSPLLLWPYPLSTSKFNNPSLT